MKNYAFLSSLALSILLAGCSLLGSDEPLLPSPRLDDPSHTDDAALLVGTWEWKHSINFWDQA